MGLFSKNHEKGNDSMSENSKKRCYTGSDYFRDGELVFINYVKEKTTPHLHSHRFIEIAFVSSGEGFHIVGGQRYSVSRGDLIVINYEREHEFRSIPGKEPLCVYNCVFQPEFIDYSLINCSDFSDISHHFLFRSLFPEELANQSDIRVTGKDSDYIETLYKKMLYEYSHMPKGYIEMLRAYTIELLVTIFRLYESNGILTDKTSKSRREIIEKTMDYLKSNYQKDVSLEHLSEISFLSPSYLCRIFKETTNKTFTEYIQSIRIGKACELLSTTDLTVLNIAYEVGYRDIKYFGKIFKKYMGCTPSTYRKKYRK